MRYLIILFFLLLISCNQNKEYNTRLIKSDSLIIPIDKSISVSSPCTYFIDSREPTLIFQNRDVEAKLNEILFFDFQNRKLDKKIVFSEDNGYYKSIHGFVPISNDSLLLSNGLTDSLYISDLSGKILYKQHFKFEEGNNYVSQIVPVSSEPIYYDNGMIYFSKSKWREKRDDFSKSNFIFSFNTKLNKFNAFNTFMPNDYINSEYFSNENSYCFDDRNIIFSPLNSHEIWIVNLKTQKLIKKSAKSDYFREFLKFSVDPPKDMQEGMYNNTYYSQYVNIIYDKYRKVYYRFFYPGLDIKKSDKNLTNEYYHPRKMSIIILDEYFNKIGEQLFSNYDFKMEYFIAPDGLYINSNNELNKNYDENKLKYTRLILIKNEK